MLRSFSLKGGQLRLQFRDGLVLALHLVREFPQTLEDLADEVLGTSGGVQYANYSLSTRRTARRPSSKGSYDELLMSGVPHAWGNPRPVAIRGRRRGYGVWN